MTTIKAAHYDETEIRLMADPIIVDMAGGLKGVPRDQLMHTGPENTPRFEFMMRANEEYRSRGGTDGGHIGAVARALLRLLDA